MAAPIKGEDRRSVQFGMRITPDMKERLVAASEDRQMSMGDIVTEALETYLAGLPSRPVPMRQRYKGAE